MAYLAMTSVLALPAAWALMLAAVRRCSSRRSCTEALAVGSKQVADHLCQAGWWFVFVALLV
eukprot:2883240-Prorocentrum_lima.AAC.1